MRIHTTENRRKRTAAARVIPALLLCVFLLGCGVWLTGCGTAEDAEMLPEEDAAAEDAAADGTATENLTAEEPVPLTVEEQLTAYIKTMSLEEKVGQMFLIRSPIVNPDEAASKYQPGGMIYFADDFEDKSPAQVRDMTADCQAASEIPLLTAVDEEGGDVNRISWYTQFRSEPFKSPQKLYAAGGWRRIVTDTAEKCQLLSGLGINVNMAPVCDISRDTSSYIYRRTFGMGAVGTSEYVSRVIRIMNQEQVGSVLKHFPGYGGNSDTHQGFSVDYRSYEAFETSDLLPFRAGIQAGAGAVLVSHNIVTCMDPEYPASLSPEVHRILREELDFEGVIMTDDLVMSAITKAYGTAEAAVQAVQAGNDMLCCSDYKTQIPAVLDAVRSGKISEERIDQSVLRILLWKHSLGLLD